MNNPDVHRKRITPSLASRRKSILAGIVLSVPASFITFLFIWGTYNVITGIAKIPSAMFPIFLLGLLEALILFFMIVILQPDIILYEDHFKLGWFFRMRTNIAFNDIAKFLRIQDPKNRIYFGFILKDGSRSFKATADIDENFIKEFIQRMESHGLGPGELLAIDDIFNFYNARSYEFEKLEKRLVEQARAGKGR